MPRTAALVSGLPLLAAVLWALWGMGPTLLRDARGALEAGAGEVLLAAGAAAGGRAMLGLGVLGLLPAGRPAGLRPADLAGTWGAAHLLGGALLALIGGPSAAVAAGLGGLLLVGRALAGPAELLPGAWERAERPGAVSSGAGLALGLAAVLLVLASASDAAEVGAALDGCALAALGAHAIARRGGGAAPRRAVALLLVLTFPLVLRAGEPPVAALALGLGGCTAMVLARWHTADRRAGAIAVVAGLLALGVAATRLSSDLALGMTEAGLAVLPSALLVLGLASIPLPRRGSAPAR